MTSTEKRKNYEKNWRTRNKDKLTAYMKKYKQEKKVELRAKARDYEQRKKQTDLNYKLSKRLRNRLWAAVKNGQKGGSAIADLGCSMDQFKVYIESLFQFGMSWDNYGYRGWHLDHIIPLKAFDLGDPLELKKACHYSNLQPLWAKDNWSKNGKTINKIING